MSRDATPKVSDSFIFLRAFVCSIQIQSVTFEMEIVSSSIYVPGGLFQINYGLCSYLLILFINNCSIIVILENINKFVKTRNIKSGYNTFIFSYLYFWSAIVKPFFDGVHIVFVNVTRRPLMHTFCIFNLYQKKFFFRKHFPFST